MLKLLANGELLLSRLSSYFIHEQINKAGMCIADNIGSGAISTAHILILRNRNRLSPSLMIVADAFVPFLIAHRRSQNKQCAFHAETLHHLRDSRWIKSVITVVKCCCPPSKTIDL